MDVKNIVLVIYLSYINIVTCQCPTNNRPIVRSSVNSRITNEISFIFFPPKTNFYANAVRYQYECGCQIMDNPKFDKNLPVYIYQHGYTENCNFYSDISSCGLVIDAVAKYSEANLIIVSYANLMSNKTSNDLFDYPKAVINVKLMGPALCSFYECFFSQCDCNRNTKVIGFSLGAQELHFTFKRCSVKPEHIIALDPAGPLFIPKESVNRNDGKFVQVIHTNPGGGISSDGPFGIDANLGTIDFWVNYYNAPIQPVCIRDAQLLALYSGSKNKCSHDTAVRYLMRTLENPFAYLAEECKSPRPEKEYMGFGVSQTKTGAYCINTDTI